MSPGHVNTNLDHANTNPDNTNTIPDHANKNLDHTNTNPDHANTNPDHTNRDKDPDRARNGSTIRNCPSSCPPSLILRHRRYSRSTQSAVAMHISISTNLTS